MQEYNQINRALTLRYGIALGLIAALSVCAFVLVHLHLKAKETHAALIQASTHQAVLSQRLTLDAGRFLLGQTAEGRQQGGVWMTGRIDEMAAAHARLTEGRADFPHPDDLSPAIASAYFDGPDALDRQVREFLDLARVVRERALPPAELRDALTTLGDLSAGPLLAGLLDMARLYEAHATDTLHDLARLHQAISVLMGVLLLVEVLFIFRPLARRLSQQTADLARMARELAATARDLAATKDEMEGMVTAIAQDLRVPSNAIRGLADWLAEDLEGQIDDVRHGLLVRLRERSHRFERLLSDLLTLCKGGVADNASGRLEVDAIGEDVLADIFVPSGFEVAFDGRLPGDEAETGPLVVVLRQLIGGMLRRDVREVGRIDVIVGWRRDEARDDVSIIVQIVSDDPDASQHYASDARESGDGDTARFGFALVGKIVTARGGMLDIVEIEGEAGAQIRLVWPMKSIRPEADPRVRMLKALDRMDEAMARAVREVGLRGGPLRKGRVAAMTEQGLVNTRAALRESLPVAS